jgi:hydroxypyruvate reductase
MNCVRKHLSAIKGGRLAGAVQPARLWTFAISDVPGDDLSVIASGPTVPDPTTFADALEILRRYQIQPTPAIQALLEAAEEETPKPRENIFSRNQVRLIATPQLMLEAAAKEAEKFGITPIILSDRIEGEAREVAKVHAAIAKQIKHRDQPLNAPAMILSGGETTVTVRGNGKGGRNAEFILSLLEALQGEEGISAIAVDTDGIDGTEDNAGAWIDQRSLLKAKQLNLKPNDFLANNDAYSFFQQLDQLVLTGPTMTNVNDFRAIFVDQP